MHDVLTLVASDHGEKLTPGHILRVEEILDECGVAIGDPKWLCPHEAVDLPIATLPDRAVQEKLRLHLAITKTDFFIQPIENRHKKLIIADMESTIIEQEMLDELAASLGLKDKIAAITARAMNGEMDFHTALLERVGMLRGLSEDVLERSLELMTLSDGAKTLIQTMKAGGAQCVLVSGGFTHYARVIAQKCGFDAFKANELIVEDTKLTGQVGEHIVDKESKKETLNRLADDLGLDPSETMAIGDGANDLDMLCSAGLGIGYHPKPAVAETINNLIIHGDLTAALYAQGYKKEDWMIFSS